jgi:hypothetical protein
MLICPYKGRGWIAQQQRGMWINLQVIPMRCLQALHDLPLVCGELLQGSRAAPATLALQCPQICTIQHLNRV